MGWQYQKRNNHGCGGNRTQSKAEHIAVSGLKTQRYCDQLDAARGVRRRVNWFTNSVNGAGHKVANWGKSRFPAGGSANVSMTSFRPRYA